MRIRILVLAWFGVFTHAAFAQPTVPMPALGTGWRCLLTPSSFYGPGTIVEIYPDDTVDSVVDLSGRVKKTSRPSAIAAFEERRTISGGIMVDLLRTVLKFGDAKVSAQASKGYMNNVSYGDVTHEMTYADAETVVNTWVRANPDKFARISRGNRFHWIREAYLAREISYNLSDELTLAVGGEAAIKKAGLFKVAVIDDTGTKRYRLNQVFNPAMRVCVKARPIGVLSAGSGGEQELGVLPSDTTWPDQLRIRQP
jgi:hypothetical protein